jgi:hypothetical protein
MEGIRTQTELSSYLSAASFASLSDEIKKYFWLYEDKIL